MKTTAKLTVTCADCPATLDLYYDHDNITSILTGDHIKHDATISSDWHLWEGKFYCPACAEEFEQTREERAINARNELAIADLELPPTNSHEWEDYK